jgi:AcrR family transcriptional regulator
MARQRIASGSQKAKRLNIARKLFHDKGYRSAGMRDMAIAYGYKASNIYSFFSNKETVLFGVIREEMEKNIAIPTTESCER